MSEPLPPATAEQGKAAWLRWAPVVLVLLAWAAHAPARAGTWVLDDVHLVRDNALVARGPSAVPAIFAGRGERAVTERFGPLTVASFAVEAPLWRRADGTLAPGGFHLTNLLLHGLCVLLLFRLALAILPRRPLVAFTGALLFAVHPLHAGTVAPLMGRSFLLGALFSLLTLAAWRAWAGRHAVWLPLAALAWMLALLATPVALGVPLVIALLDAAAPPRPAPGAEPVAGARAYVLVFLAPLAVFLATWAGPVTAGLDLPAQPLGERLVVGFEGLARALLAFVLPVGLRGDHSDEAHPGLGFVADTATIVCVVLLLAVTVLVLVRAWRGRAGLLSACWLATMALALPAFAVLPAGGAHESWFAYLVLLPVCLAAGRVGEGLAGLRTPARSGAFQRARAALVGGVAVLALVGLSQREAAGWQDDAAFHERLLHRSPRHVRAMIRLARAQRTAAARLRASAAALPADAPERGAQLQMRAEALAQALSWAQRAVRHGRGREDPEAWRELGFAQLATDKAAAALRSLERARSLDPVLRKPVAELIAGGVEERLARAAEMYFAIGRCRESLGEQETSADAFLTASRLVPDNLEYMQRAGTGLCRANRYAEGLRLLLEARRRTVEPRARRRLDDLIDSARRSAREISARLIRDGESAQAEGEMRKAVVLYEQACEVNPASARAWIRAGWLRGMWFGSYTTAESYFRKAEALLRKGRVDENDIDWRQLRDFRAELAKQKAEEDAEQAPDDGG